MMIAVVLISVSVASAAFFIANNVEYISVGMHLKVADYMGFNVDTDAMYFGTVGPGSVAERDLEVNNELSVPREVVVQLSGELAPWVKPDEGTFILAPNENRSIKFTASPPEDAEFGEYNGTITLIIKNVN